MWCLEKHKDETQRNMQFLTCFHIRNESADKRPFDNAAVRCRRCAILIKPVSQIQKLLTAKNPRKSSTYVFLYFVSAEIRRVFFCCCSACTVNTRSHLVLQISGVQISSGWTQRFILDKNPWSLMAYCKTLTAHKALWNTNRPGFFHLL